MACPRAGENRWLDGCQEVVGWIDTLGREQGKMIVLSTDSGA